VTRNDKAELPGTLHVVATPIGNLRDITLRALDVLRAATLIAAEDTRRTRKLLSAHDIRARLTSLHARSPEKRIETLIEHLLSVGDVAYVTDAGSPVISDPGSQLVDAAHRREIAVRTIPGPSAVTSALAVAGLPADDFRFMGFLPRGRGKRRNLLSEAGAAGCALLLFESPGRARALLEDLAEALPDRRIALCRELTKVHEEVLRGTATELLAALPEKPRGEMTVVVAAGPPSGASEVDDEALLSAARELRAQGLSTRQAAKQLATELSISKTHAYQLIVHDEENK